MSNANDHLLGRLAVHYRLLKLEQLTELLRDQQRSGERLGELLVSKGFATEGQLAKLVKLQQEHLAKQAATAQAPAPTPAAAAPAAESPKPVVAVAVLDGALEKMNSRALLETAVRLGASDLHLHAEATVRARVHGVLLELSAQVLPAQACSRIVNELLDPAQRERLKTDGQVDFVTSIAGVGRFRGNAYRQQRGIDCTLRSVPAAPPTLASLGLPTSLAKLTNHHQGLVLLTGPAGSGKSATMAALLNIVNEERRDHIITIEDPIECVHPPKLCSVNQRQVGAHTESFARALRAALREDPDVIGIGELRDLETISLALSAAETGHLVLATLHTNSAIQTIHRIVGAFPAAQQGQVRAMLSESLRAVVSQRLVPRADGQGRIVALEMLMVNRAVGNVIREDKVFQLRSTMQTGSAHGMCLLDNSLHELVTKNVITAAEAQKHAEDKTRFRQAEVRHG